MRRKCELGLALFSIVAALAHFVATQVHHQAFGQFLPNLWVDHAADLLLLIAGVRLWRGPGAAGFACGAWGFGFCLSALAFNDLFLQTLEGRVTPGVEQRLAAAALALLLSALAFALGLALAWRRTPAP